MTTEESSELEKLRAEVKRLKAENRTLSRQLIANAALNGELLLAGKAKDGT